MMRESTGALLARRDVLRGGVYAVALAAAPACRLPPPRREDVLARLVVDVIVPDMTEVRNTSASLRAAVEQLAASPTLLTLGAARAGWRAAILIWKRAQCMGGGPASDTNAFSRACFWPSRPAAIRVALESTARLDDAAINMLGVDAKGLFALEYLLFPEALGDDATLALFASEAGQRRGHLARLLANNIARYAQQAFSSIGELKAYAATFSRDGQATISRLVAHMVHTMETVAALRIGVLLGVGTSQARRPNPMEGLLSEMSQQIVLTQLEATERIYAGTGLLGELVRPAAPAIDAQIRATFTQAVTSVRRLAGPLESVLESDRPALAEAAAATKALELALKVDLASALGVTLTFQSGDGD